MPILGFLLVLVGVAGILKPAWLRVRTPAPGVVLLVAGLFLMGRGAGYVLFYVGLLGMVVGLVSLLRPLHRLRIATRKVAAAVLTASFVLTMVGAAIAGPGAPPPPPRPQQAEAPPADTGQQPQDQSPAAPSQPSPSPSEASPQPGGTATGTAPDSQQENAPQTPSQAEPREPALPPGITVATVTRVVDGDTIDVEHVSGAKLPATRVRLIGVDTPEVHGKREPYGPEASEFTKRQLTGKTVWLEKDVSETDRYGRALRYVWLVEPPSDPTEKQVREGMFNAILVLQGYAQVLTYPPDVKYADLLVKFQREAREADRGLWALDSSSSKKSSPSTSTRSSSGSKSSGSSSGSTSGGSSGKSSKSSSGGGSSKVAKRCDPAYPDVCIPPPPPDLDCGDIPYRHFRVLPPDPHGLDGRDKDGIGCES